MLRESLMKGRDWHALAAQQQKRQFGPAAKALAREQLQTMMQSFELLCKIEEQWEQQQQAAGTAAGATAAGSSSSSGSGSLVDRGGASETEVLQATVRVVCSRQVRMCVCRGGESF